MVPFLSRLFGETLGRISNSPIETLAQKQTKSSFSNPGNSGFSREPGSKVVREVVYILNK
jgi:hypothetical protein